MTTISDVAARTRPADRLLRVALKVDAIASGLTGLGFVSTPEMFRDLYGLPSALTVPTGAFLLAFAAGLWFLASRPRISAGAVGSIIVLNVAWVAASIAVLAAGPPLTTIGIGYVIAQAVAVAALAELEFIGLRRVVRAR